MTLAQILDVLAMIAALAAAWLWFRASGSRLRRVSRFESLDASDLNRVVVMLNRSQILNSRGALAAMVSALCAAARFAVSAFG